MVARIHGTTPFRLITLGRVALETPEGEDADLARRRRKLALLAVLALSEAPRTRSELAAMFWGDEDEERARHSLSDALSHLRRVLGRHAITGRSEVVQLDLRERLTVDAIELDQAFSAGDHATVQRLYAGEFLAGMPDGQSAGFDEWVSRAREHYASRFTQSEELNRVALPVEAAPVLATATTLRRRALVGTAVAAAIAGFTVAVIAMSRTNASAATTPVIALTSVRTDPADTTLAWLREGLKQMIAADLGRVTSAGVVAPAVVRELGASRSSNDSLSSNESIAIARRLHANWAASGTVSRRQGTYVVEIVLRDVEHRDVTHRYSVSGDDILVVADQAAARMLSTLNAGGAGPRLSDVETANTDAYRHFIASEEAQADGRYDDEIRELDAAIAADSGFTSAIVARIPIADAQVYNRLKPLFDRAKPRMTEWDRLSEAVFYANHHGQPASAESLGRALVARYPRDPRSLRSLAELLTGHALYPAAESTYLRLAVLDSASSDQRGPCWACEAYFGLSTVRHMRGDFAGEIDAARRWTVLRPAAPAAWLDLANSLELNGELAGAENAFVRYRQLAGADKFDPFTGRMLITARRLDEAEEYARRYLKTPEASDAYDILQTVLRERGQFRDALKVFDSWRASTPAGVIDLVYAHMLGQLGDDRRARAVFERTWHPVRPEDWSSMYGHSARGYAWSHALEGDAIWMRADTVQLRAFADSIKRISPLSFYARDWTVHHHLLGLIAERAGRLAEARQEFELAMSLVPGWTRTNIELAKVEMRLGDPVRAIATLRLGYHQTIDAMGRYAPRTELDYQMARAFVQSKQDDSARKYSSYVRAAWVRADPEFRGLMRDLP